MAKSKSIHQNLQSQFIKRKVQKEYIAVLDGLIDTESGTIDLPLRVDLDNRPHQLVCYEHGKKAVTKYKVIDVQSGKTRILFYPITGRTHQLRVHAAHSLGLNAPILGDDLYGVPADRLHLHARSLRFNHPIKHEEMTFVIEADF